MQEPTTKVINSILNTTANTTSTATDQKDRFVTFEKKLLDKTTVEN